MTTKSQFKILSIDGGGIRGIIPCTILKFIEEQVGVISDTFDLVAGTSTGGIIALGVCTKTAEKNDKPRSASEMLDLYVNNGRTIFDGRKQKWLSNIIDSVNPSIGDLLEKPYPSKSIEKLLKNYFGDSNLTDTATDVLITTYDMKKGRPFYYSSRLARQDDNENHLIREIARSTSAAPTFFEPNFFRYKGNQDVVAVDGGVVANNPSVLAYAEAKEFWKIRQLANSATAIKTFDPQVIPIDADFPFFMLSIGTGYSTEPAQIDDIANWRSGRWIKPLLNNVFIQASVESTDYVMHHLLPPYLDQTPRYQRFNVGLPASLTSMDDASPDSIARLQEISEQYVKKNRSKLLSVCELLK